MWGIQDGREFQWIDRQEDNRMMEIREGRGSRPCGSSVHRYVTGLAGIQQESMTGDSRKPGTHSHAVTEPRKSGENGK